MTIEFRCDPCATRYQVNEDRAGQKTVCERCGAEWEVPFPPLEIPEEVTRGGSVLHRHEPRLRGH